ncbi:hypothetical protein [Streptomyces sp. NBC_00191]|uniref:hypothetical protein n=1 Tax=Streptomyces sp. NBC_00191 TaxID=2975674 RepID=UPI00324F04F7
MSTAQAADTAILDTNKVISLPDGRGKMTYIDDGDMFEVCDTRADGHGVEGQLVRKGGTTLITVSDGGDAGCDKKGYNVPNSGEYQMQLWWQGGGAAQYSQWFNE